MTYRRSARLAALTFACLTLAGALAPDRVEAQTVRDRLRLSADLTFFQFQKTNVSTDFGDADDKSSYFGFLNQGLGLSVGASIGERLFIGGRLVLERSQSHNEGDDSAALAWTLEPFAELMFLDGPVVPFALAGIGFEGFVFEDSGGDREKTNYFGFRFGGGAHIFLADSFSLDPRIELGWATDIAGEDDGVDESVIRFSIIVGFSGWFGGGDAAPAEASPFAGGGTDPYTGAPVAGPTGPTPANETVETLDFGGGVSVTMAGAPQRDDLKLAFQRRGTAPVLSGCSDLVWQIDGQTAEMPVSHRTTPSEDGMTETLEGVTASNNAALLGHARVVTLTVCGASFTLTPQHLQQLSAFAQRLQGPAATPQQDAWPPTAY
jgi:opacity protein-like surface antigen